VFSIESHVGRVIEVRIQDLETVKEVDLVGRRFLAVVAGVRKSRVIVCADYRGVHLLAARVADAFRDMMATTNPRVERSAMLLPPPSTQSLQIDRIARETRYVGRRTFREASALERWLAEVLDSPERRRVHEFLGGDTTGA
jgi:hypothetical protein